MSNKPFYWLIALESIFTTLGIHHADLLDCNGTSQSVGWDSQIQTTLVGVFGSIQVTDFWNIRVRNALLVFSCNFLRSVLNSTVDSNSILEILDACCLPFSQRILPNWTLATPSDRSRLRWLLSSTEAFGQSQNTSGSLPKMFFYFRMKICRLCKVTFIYLPAKYNIPLL